MLASSLLLSLVLPLQTQAPLSETTWHLPELGLRVYETRWLDNHRGTILRKTQLADGTPVDLDALREKDHAQGVERRGSMSPDLVEHLRHQKPESLVDVVFWLETRDAPDWRVLIDDQISQGIDGEDARRFARDQAEIFFSGRTAQFSEWCTSMDITVTDKLGAWPVVYATMPAHLVPLAAKQPLVDEAYYCFPEVFSELDHAQGTMRTPIVWDRGMTATGSPVKTMVNDPDHVTTSNPYLPPITKIYGNGGTGSHASACAGNIAMNHTTHKGAAYGIPRLYSADGTGDSGAPASWNAAISNGISFGNCSWWNGSKGSIVYLDRFFDYTIRNYSMMMFKSTGNQGNTSTPYTTSPGNGYNSTNSGSYSDKNNTVWAGDSMASYSSYWDPSQGHEKPELANAGDDVDTTGTSGWYTGFGGTSSASPLTCGVATLMATRDNALMTKPEAVKAVLMASAWHNIEGDDVLSEKDGAGGVHALAADSCLERGNYRAVTLTSSDFNNPTNSYDVTIPAAAGQDVRVCGLWFSKANSAYSTDVLEMDLDLTILSPNGTVVASSANTKNAFEILKFSAPVSGKYTARFVSAHFRGTTEPFCVAWSDRYDTGEARIELLGTPTVGGNFSVVCHAPFSPNQTLQINFSGGGLPGTVNLGSGHVLALRPDAIYNWSATQSNFTNTLNSAGSASFLASVPNNPVYAGRRIWVAAHVRPNASSSDITTVSRTESFVIQP